MDADAPIQQKTLEEFLSSVEDAVSRGAPPNPGPAIAEGDTYPTVHDFFLKRPSLVAEWSAAATDEERLRAAKSFLSYKKDIFEPRGPELKQLHREKEIPTGPVSPIREKAITDTGNGLLIHKKQKEAAVQSEFARKVVQNFVTRLREQRLYGTPEDIEKTVDRELKKTVYAATENEAKTALIENVSQAPEFSRDRHAAETIAKNVLDESKEFIAEKQRETTVDVAAAKKVIEDPTLVDTKTFVETLTTRSVGNNQPLAEQINYAVDASRAATVVNASRINAEGMQAGGALTNVLMRIPGVKEAAIEQAFANAWTRTALAENSIEMLTTRFGAEVVRSKPFQDIIKSGTDTAQQKHAAGAVAGSLGKIAGDVLVSVKGPPSEEMLHYISALYQKQAGGGGVSRPTSFQFVVTLLYIKTPDSFSASPSAGGMMSNLMLNYVANKALKEGGKAIAGKVASGGLAKLIGGIFGTAVGGPGPGSAVGAFLAGAVTSLGGKLFGGIKGWLEGRSASGELIPVPSASSLLYIVLFAAVGFLIIFSFPEINRQMALVTSYGAGTGGAMGQPGAEGGGTVPGPIGSVTSSCANTQGVYLSQADAKWKTVTYSGAPQCTIENCGCGPTSVTMILHAFGSTADIRDVWARVAAASGTGSSSMGCSTGIQPNLDVLRGAGLATTYLGNDWASAGKEADLMLKSCHLIFAWGIAHHNGRDIWHFIVIDGINWSTSGNDVVSFGALDPYWGQGTQDGSTYSILGLWAVGK